MELVKSASLPAGILGDVETELMHKKADSGDILIMLSDGVVDSFAGEEAGERALMKFIQDIKSINPQQIADDILDESLQELRRKARRRHDGHSGKSMEKIRITGIFFIFLHKLK